MEEGSDSEGESGDFESGKRDGSSLSHGLVPPPPPPIPKDISRKLPPLPPNPEQVIIRKDYNPKGKICFCILKFAQMDYSSSDSDRLLPIPRLRPGTTSWPTLPAHLGAWTPVQWEHQQWHSATPLVNIVPQSGPGLATQNMWTYSWTQLCAWSLEPYNPPPCPGFQFSPTLNHQLCGIRLPQTNSSPRPPHTLNGVYMTILQIIHHFIWNLDTQYGET